MAKNYHDLSLALAGVCQAAKLVQQLATNEKPDQVAMDCLMRSILQTNPRDLSDIYNGDERNLSLGIQTILEQLSGDRNEITEYWIRLVAVANKLRNSPQAKEDLANRLAYLPDQLEYSDLLSDEMFSRFASIYVDIISPLSSKIRVVGHLEALQNEQVQDRIRACLLAGVRFAYLWYQLGGSKWQLLFASKKIFNAAEEIADSFHIH